MKTGVGVLVGVGAVVGFSVAVGTGVFVGAVVAVCVGVAVITGPAGAAGVPVVAAMEVATAARYSAVVWLAGVGVLVTTTGWGVNVAVTMLGGVGVAVDDDGWTIRPGAPHGAVVETYDDHRMAMSFALLGLVTEGIAIAGPGCVAKTFPGYWDLLDGLRPGRGDR